MKINYFSNILTVNQNICLMVESLTFLNKKKQILRLCFFGILDKLSNDKKSWKARCVGEDGEKRNKLKSKQFFDLKNRNRFGTEMTIFFGRTPRDTTIS